eukprot:7011202-Prymnesium_polylepis.1
MERVGCAGDLWVPILHLLTPPTRLCARCNVRGYNCTRRARGEVTCTCAHRVAFPTLHVRLPAARAALAAWVAPHQLWHISASLIVELTVPCSAGH